MASDNFIQQSTRLSTILCGKEGEKIARQYLRNKYPGCKISSQVDDIDLVVKIKKRELLYEVKSASGRSGSFFFQIGRIRRGERVRYRLDQLNRVDRVLFVIRETATVSEVAVKEVKGWVEKYIQDGKLRFAWYGRRKVQFDGLTLEKELRKLGAEERTNDFRIKVENNWCVIQRKSRPIILIKVKDVFTKSQRRIRV